MANSWMSELTRCGIALAVVCPLMMCGTSAHAQCETAKLLASDGGAGDRFGDSVVIKGDIAAAGASGEGEGGAVYVYRFEDNEWSEEAKLMPSDGSSEDKFGKAIAVDANCILVGSARDDDQGVDSGSAYVFRYSGGEWTEEAKLLPNDGAADDRFGISVALSDDRAIIGAHFDDDFGSDSGSAYFFQFDGSEWIQRQKIVPDDIEPWDVFGWSIAIDADRALISSYGHDEPLNNEGCVFIFEYDGSTWLEQAKLLASDPAPTDYFGYAVAIAGDLIAASALRDDDMGSSAGSVYVFRLEDSVWEENAKLLASDGASGDEFGVSVSVSTDTVLVGAWYDDDVGADSGAVYRYRYDGDTWVETKLVASDAAQGDLYGHNVSISGDVAIVGARWADDFGSESGTAYILSGMYEIDCNENGVPDACDIHDGTSQDCQPNGIPDECDIADGTSEDCQPNGVPDECDIADGTSYDEDGNGIPDECEECLGDVVEDGTVDVSDLLVLLSKWGPCPPVGECYGDVDFSGEVDVVDLILLLGAWGPCE